MAQNLTEREFLKKLAVDMFNAQYRKSVDWTTCGVRSILPTYGTTHGYEIETVRSSDFVRMRMYFNLAGLTDFSPYRIEVDSTYINDELGDEVYVTMGKVDPMWVEDGIYRFRWLTEDTSAFEMLTFVEDDSFIQFMDNDHIRLAEQPGD